MTQSHYVHCTTQVLDVFEIDRLAGFHPQHAPHNFHVPERASLLAALATLLDLRQGVGAQYSKNCRRGGG